MKKFILKLLNSKFSRNIDPEIPSSVLYSFCFGKVISLLWGMAIFHKKVFLERRVNLKNKKNIHFGKNLRIAENVTIDALSVNGVVFGNNCSVGKNTRIEVTGSFEHIGNGFKCGNNCGLGTDSFYGCAGGIELGNDVIVGNFVSFHSENHNYSNSNRSNFEFKKKA